MNQAGQIDNWENKHDTTTEVELVSDYFDLQPYKTVSEESPVFFNPNMIMEKLEHLHPHNLLIPHEPVQMMMRPK